MNVTLQTLLQQEMRLSMNSKISKKDWMMILQKHLQEEEKVGHKVKILVKVLSCLISPKAHHVLLEVVLAAISPIK